MDKFKPSPIQTLFLWRLLVDPDGAWLSEIKPKLTPVKKREALLDAGLISIDKKRNANNRLVNYVTLTEQGWHWAEEHLDAELPTQGTAALYILRQIMTRLKARVAEGELSLAAFCATLDQPKVAPPSPSVPAEARAALKRRIIAECQGLAEGAYSGRIRLADLRSSLPDVPPTELNETLLELESARQLVVYPLDDPQDIKPSDQAAALPNSSGDPRHLVYLQSSH